MNLFEDAEDWEQAVYYAVGAASMCWESVITAGVFDDTLARKVAEDLIDYIKEHHAST